MATTLPNLLSRVTDLNGKVVSFARLYVYLAGTTTLATVYSDEATTTPYGAYVEADIGGLLPTVYFADGSYKLQYTDSSDVPVCPTIDDYNVATGGGTSAIAFPPITKTANFTVQSSNRANVFECDASGAAGQNILVSADSSTLGAGFPCWVINTGSAGTITLQAIGGQTFNGASSLTISSQHGGVGMVSDGASGWRVFSTEGVFVNAVQFNNTATFGGAMATVSGPIATPGGRLTLTSATPVLTSDVTAGTTVYYTPYLHNFIMLYNGVTAWETRGFAEMSQALSDTTKSPAAAASSSAYDVFVWDDAGTLRATRGPAWTNTTTRSAGTALTRQNGMLVNAVAITNGPAIGRGVYVGSFVTNASTQVQWVANPAAAAGGGNCQLSLWNMYNRVDMSATSIESSSWWSYNSATPRSQNGSNSNRITIFNGLNETKFNVRSSSRTGQSSNPTTGYNGIGVDVTNAASGLLGSAIPDQGQRGQVIAEYDGFVGIGSHFFQSIEFGQDGTTWYWYGGVVSGGAVSAIKLSGMM